jgi:cytosine/adenosine deaminase-related metal-dependent hydrolase
MKRFTAQYVFTNSGPPLKRAVINTEDDGTILSVSNTEGDLKETHNTEYHNGIIIPGFVNCHCHLELSHMRDSVSKGQGLPGFIEQVRSSRNSNEDSFQAAYSADNFMYREGISACADICNTADTFKIKKESKISYINLLEVFGLDPEKAYKRMTDLLRVAETARMMGINYSLIPHSTYSMSLTLFRLLKSESLLNKVTSIHFMETPAEEIFLKSHSGPLESSYKKSGLIPARLEVAENHDDVILNQITGSGNLILVHNTFTGRDTIRKVKQRENLFWCLCPKSNIYIENKIPDINLLIEEDCTMVIGTDSLASNSTLSILEELKTIHDNFPEISLEDLISWGTINGAKALNEEKQFGSIEPGKKPGLLVLENVDLQKMELLPESFVTRLI